MTSDCPERAVGRDRDPRAWATDWFLPPDDAAAEPAPVWPRDPLPSAAPVVAVQPADSDKSAVCS